jgi:NADH-quinone oxidoreductase subunit A
MNELVAYLLLFLAVGAGFIFIHLVAGKLFRPIKPDPEKLTIYECGEPTIGSSWIQFDLRFYVVALLFVIFDVEVAFFFPWAVVFGKANSLATNELSPKQREQLSAELVPSFAIATIALEMREQREQLSAELVPGDRPARPEPDQGEMKPPSLTPETAHEIAWLAFWDIVVFFGVLLVGFAYLWKRGDLNWVRSVAAERVPDASHARPPGPTEAATLVGSGRDLW